MTTIGPIKMPLSVKDSNTSPFEHQKVTQKVPLPHIRTHIFTIASIKSQCTPFKVRPYKVGIVAVPHHQPSLVVVVVCLHSARPGEGADGAATSIFMRSSAKQPPACRPRPQTWGHRPWTPREKEKWHKHE